MTQEKLLHGSVSSSHTPRPLAPKQVDKEPARLSLAQKKDLVDKWMAHCDSYRKSLGTSDPSMTPSVLHFEKVNGLRSGALAPMIKNMDHINMVPEQSQHERNHARAGVRPFYPVEKIVNKLIIYLRERKVTVDVWLVRLLAMIVYEHLLERFGEMTFPRPKFSHGWARRFMLFWGYSRTRLRGEADSVVWTNIKDEVKALQELIATFKMTDVYNADESGLFLQTMSNVTVDNEKRSGTKSVSSRVSILFCTNATGTDKVKPFILSEYFPQGFKTDAELQNSVDFVHWKESKRPFATDPPAAEPAEGDVNPQPESQVVLELSKTDPKKRKTRADYMNTYTFYYWLLLFQKHVLQNNPSRRVLLLVDNCSCHEKAANIANDLGHIPNIVVAYLPKNSTSVTQPLDAGIIAVFKKRYRDILLAETAMRYLKDPFADPFADPAEQPKETPLNFRISNLDAWRYIVQAWAAIKEVAIRHCFHHVPIISDTQKAEELDCLDHNTEVEKALEETQQNAITLARTLAIRHALSGVESAPEEDQSVIEEIEDCDSQPENAVVNEKGEAKEDPIVTGVATVFSTQSHLSALVMKMLDNLPYLDKVITKESEDDRYFNAKFIVPASGSSILEFDDLTDDGSNDGDFIESPVKSHLRLKSLSGSPLKMATIKFTRNNSYTSELFLQAEDTSDSESGYEDDKQPLRTGPEQSIRGKVHQHLTEAAKFIVKLPGPSADKSTMLQLLADSLVTPDYFDGESADYFNKFIEKQAERLEEYRRLKGVYQKKRAEDKAKLAKKRAEEKARLAEEKKIVDSWLPGRKRRGH